VDRCSRRCGLGAAPRRLPGNDLLALEGVDKLARSSGAILFLETSEAAPPPEDVDSYLTDLEQLGVFDSAAALLFARPYGYDVKDTDALWSVVADRTEQSGIPVLANIEAGHTDPMMTLPLGVPAEIDTANKHLRLLEPATANRA